MTGYRRDIDGLRAIAVLGVIFAHAGFSAPQAGYAGVDIFFVISGYLIGGAIVSESRAGSFSFRDFYARRARRILPALFFMIAATLPVAWVLMTPDQLRYFGGGALSSVLFVANIWFFNRIDYFNPEAASDPLVHLWSLGIEEQFYLVIPIVLVFIIRWNAGRTLPVLAVLAGISFFMAVSLAQESPMEAFYLIHTRAWELLAGVLAAIVAPRLHSGATVGLRNIAAMCGLAAVLAGLFLIPSTAPWPGLYALVPVGGGVLLVMFAGQGAAGKILGWPPLVGIGLISYSAYLWHQPIFGFLKISGLDLHSSTVRLLVIVACLLVSWASWRWIEQPFRRQRISTRKSRLWLIGAAATIALFAIGGHVTRGYPFRMSDEVLTMLENSTSWPETYRSCISGRDEGERLDPAKACIHGAKVPARVAIWGDSHAAVLAKPLGDALAAQGYSVRELTVGSCVPILGLKNSALKRTEYCAEHNQKMLDYLVASTEVDVVVLNGFWNSYVERRDFDTRAGWIQTDQVIALPLDADASMPDDVRLSFMAARLQDQVRALLAAGKDIVLLYPLPEAGFDPPEEMARRLWRGEAAPSVLGYPTDAFEDYSGLSRTLLDAAGDDPRIHRVDSSGAFCDRGALCRIVEGGVPLLFNENHLSLAGSAKVIPLLAAEISRILKDRGPDEN